MLQLHCVMHISMQYSYVPLDTGLSVEGCKLVNWDLEVAVLGNWLSGILILQLLAGKLSGILVP